MLRHQYESAIYIGDKLLALTSIKADLSSIFEGPQADHNSKMTLMMPTSLLRYTSPPEIINAPRAF